MSDATLIEFRRHGVTINRGEVSIAHSGVECARLASLLRRVADQLDPEPEDGRLGDADDLVGWVSELDTELHSAQALTDARIEDVRDEFSERLDAIKEQLDDLSRRHSRTSQRLTRFGEHLDMLEGGVW